MEEIIIDNKTDNQRLDKYLRRYFPGAAASFLYRMLREKKIKLNGKKAEGSRLLAPGDVITVYFAEETLKKFKMEADDANKPAKRIKEKNSFDFSDIIVYEDENVIIIDKPAGMLSQKAAPSDISVCEYLVDYLINKDESIEKSLRTYRPSAVNRLDRNTSGLLICAKTLPAAQQLSKMLKDRTLKKEYLALVHGHVSGKKDVCAYLKKDRQSNRVDVSLTYKEGYEKIETVYEPISHAEGTTLLGVDLITGKTHQIRAHLCAMGHSIVGDRKYISKNAEVSAIKLRRQFLHAYRLTFPVCEGALAGLSKQSFTAELPQELRKSVKNLTA